MILIITITLIELHDIFPLPHRAKWHLHSSSPGCVTLAIFLDRLRDTCTLPQQSTWHLHSSSIGYVPFNSLPSRSTWYSPFFFNDLSDTYTYRFTVSIATFFSNMHMKKSFLFISANNKKEPLKLINANKNKNENMLYFLYLKTYFALSFVVGWFRSLRRIGFCTHPNDWNIFTVFSCA